MPSGIFAGYGLQRPKQMVGPLLEFAQDEGHCRPAHPDNALIRRVKHTLLNVGKKPAFTTPGFEQILESSGQARLILQRRSMHMRPVRHPFHHLQDRRLRRFWQRAYFFVDKFRLIHRLIFSLDPIDVNHRLFT